MQKFTDVRIIFNCCNDEIIFDCQIIARAEVKSKNLLEWMLFKTWLKKVFRSTYDQCSDQQYCSQCGHLDPLRFSCNNRPKIHIKHMYCQKGVCKDSFSHNSRHNSLSFLWNRYLIYNNSLDKTQIRDNHLQNFTDFNEILEIKDWSRNS